MKKFGIIASLAILLVSCTPKTLPPGVSQEEIWREGEKQRQMAAVEQIDKQQDKKTSRIKMDERIVRVSSNLMKAGVDICGAFKTDKSLCVYEFELTEKGPINAWADGKSIYITPAMMQFIKSDEELSYVLGHEYAHNIMDHVGKTGFNVLVGAVAGSLIDGLFASQGANSGGQFSDLGAEVGQLAYSQEFEQEADYIGLYIATRAGYDVSHAPNVWRRMAVKNPDEIYTATTHPTTAERFVMMEKSIREIKDKKKSGKPLLPEFKPKELAPSTL